MIELTSDICRDLEASSRREWLETNGLGGFASGTVAGMHTRRYHGLLVAALKPPVGRYVLLSKFEETLVINGKRIELSANRYAPDVLHPRGFEFLTNFRLDPFPVFRYVVEDVEVEKSVFLIQGENSVVVEYLIRAATADDVRLELRPLIAFREFHSTTHENNAINRHVEIGDGRVTFAPYPGLPPLHLAHDPAAVDPRGCWYRNFEYREERARGLDANEDLYSPCALVFQVRDKARISLIASTEERDVSHAAAYRSAEIDRRRRVAANAPYEDSFAGPLTAVAGQFLAARGAAHTVIAGYPWFGDWGRDTMIAMPGLALVTGRHDVARSILREFARYVDGGMLPNVFPDGGETPEYNTVDAALWFVEAACALDDPAFVRRELWPALQQIIDCSERGTRYGIRMDADGLLRCGEPGVQLTWMDAKVGDWVVTPRCGKPVEVQALWYNALRIMEQFAREFVDPNADRYGEMARRATRSFDEQFWNEAAGCLFDVVDGDERDASIRPNQVFAVSLRHPLAGGDRAKRILAVVERELLTPFGLRSLAPGDPRYRGRYEGGVLERDGAYHQGTVWAWLMGPFVTAYARVHGDAGRERAREWLYGFEPHLREAGLGTVSEIFDGDWPHTPRGCIAQAWSVAELLRAAVETRAAVSEGAVSEDIHSAGGQYGERRQRENGLNHHEELGPTRQDGDIGGRERRARIERHEEIVHKARMPAGRLVGFARGIV